jgi:hypothetical protein
MHDKPDNARLGLVVLVIITTVLLHSLARWWRGGVLKPDPWETVTGEGAQLDESAVELCHRCFEPQEPGNHFCPKCGAATGPCNNWMPYEQLFSIGEVLRNGTNGSVKRTPLTVAGYLLLSFSEYVIFAPLYWYRWWKGQRKSAADMAADASTNDPGKG